MTIARIPFVMAAVSLALTSTPALALKDTPPSEPRNCISVSSKEDKDPVRSQLLQDVREVVRISQATNKLDLCEAPNSTRYMDWRLMPTAAIVYDRSLFEGLYLGKASNDMRFYLISWSLANINLGHGPSEVTTGSLTHAQVMQRYLDTDDLAGYWLGKGGRRTDEAERFIAFLISDSPSDAFPGRSQRITALRRGWERGHREASAEDLAHHYYGVPSGSKTYVSYLFALIRDSAEYIAAVGAGIAMLYAGFVHLRRRKVPKPNSEADSA